MSIPFCSIQCNDRDFLLLNNKVTLVKTVDIYPVVSYQRHWLTNAFFFCSCQRCVTTKHHPCELWNKAWNSSGKVVFRRHRVISFVWSVTDMRITSRTLVITTLLGVDLAIGVIGMCKKMLPPIHVNQNNTSTESLKLSKSDLISCDSYDELVTILEELSILTPRQTSCYTLTDIKRQVLPLKNSNQRRISVTLEVVENFVQANGNSYSVGDQNNTTTSTCVSSRSSLPPGVRSLSRQRVNGTGNDNNHNGSSALPAMDAGDTTNNEDSGGMLPFPVNK